jgi:cardiolipin synthase
VAPHDILLQGLAGLHLLVSGAVVVDLLRQHRSPPATLAWMAILLLLPWLGLLLYVLAGAPRKRSAALARYFAEHAQVAPAAPVAACPDTEPLLRALGLPAATGGNALRLCLRNEDAADELLRLIRGARHRLLLSVFSFEADAAGERILEAMRERAAAGVQVRMLVDGYGSMNLAAPGLRRLQAAGGRVARYRPLAHAGSVRGAFNYRNHRKMVIADGAEAWVGGRNLALKYLATSADGSHWTDLSLVVAGPAAALFESVFRSDWLTATGETLSTEVARLASSPRGDSVVQVLASGPDLPDDTLHAVLLAGIMGARRRVWIVSPFFVPDDALHSALQLACRRGLDVRVLLPRRSNLWLADRVRTTYLEQVSAAGARVLLYEPGVLHAKIVVFDGRVALVGSANFDMRSLFTNHEVAAVLYGAADVASVAAIVEDLASRATAMPRADGFATTVLSGALRIVAPLL